MKVSRRASVSEVKKSSGRASASDVKEVGGRVSSELKVSGRASAPEQVGVETVLTLPEDKFTGSCYETEPLSDKFNEDSEEEDVWEEDEAEAWEDDEPEGLSALYLARRSPNSDVQCDATCRPLIFKRLRIRDEGYSSARARMSC